LEVYVQKGSHVTGKLTKRICTAIASVDTEKRVAIYGADGFADEETCGQLKMPAMNQPTTARWASRTMPTKRVRILRRLTVDNRTRTPPLAGGLQHGRHDEYYVVQAGGSATHTNARHCAGT
jgi:hypothetical protein